MKEEISGGHKVCTVPETGYCLIATPLVNPSEAHHNAAGSEVSLMRRSSEPGLFSPVIERLRDISAVCVQISVWRAQKDMQPGSFQ